jgi:hypothetical protein
MLKQHHIAKNVGPEPWDDEQTFATKMYLCVQLINIKEHMSNEDETSQIGSSKLQLKSKGRCK